MKWNKYKEKIIQRLNDFYFDDKISSIIKNSIRYNQKIFIAGNGGSAAIANHLSCDLSKGATPEWRKNENRYKIISLSNNISYMTAISNDEKYEDIFKQQLINLANPNDIIILISSSGNSPNVVSAAEYANNIGMTTISLTGFDGGKLKAICEYNAHVDTNMYETAEDIHAIFGHFLAVCLRENTEVKESDTLLLNYS